jgi:hypothetical protein
MCGAVHIWNPPRANPPSTSKNKATKVKGSPPPPSQKGRRCTAPCWLPSPGCDGLKTDFNQPAAAAWRQRLARPAFAPIMVSSTVQWELHSFTRRVKRGFYSQTPHTSYSIKFLFHCSLFTPLLKLVPAGTGKLWPTPWLNGMPIQRK